MGGGGGGREGKGRVEEGGERHEGREHTQCKETLGACPEAGMESGLGMLADPKR